MEIKNNNIQKDKHLQRQVIILLSKYFSLLVAIIVIVIIICGCFFVVKPKYEKNKVKNKEAIKNTTDIINVKKIYLSELNRYVRLYDNIDKKQKDKISAILPDDPGINSLYAKIDSLMSENNFTLTSLKISDKSNIKTKQTRRSPSSKNDSDKNDKIFSGVSEINLSIDVDDVDYRRVKKLLKIIENNLRLMDVKKISFLPEGGSAKLEISVYYLKGL